MSLRIDISSAPATHQNARALHLRLSENIDALVLVEHPNAGHEPAILLDQSVAAISATLTSTQGVQSLSRRAEMALERANQAVYGKQVILSNSRDILLSATVVLVSQRRFCVASVGGNAVILLSARSVSHLITPETVGARLRQQGLQQGTDAPEHKTNVHGLGEPPAMFQVRQTFDGPMPPDARMMLLGAGVATFLPVEELAAVFAPFLERSEAARQIHHTFLSRRGEGSAVAALTLRQAEDLVLDLGTNDSHFESSRSQSLRLAIAAGVFATLLMAVLILWFSNSSRQQDEAPHTPPPPTHYLPQKSNAPADELPANLHYLDVDVQIPLPEDVVEDTRDALDELPSDVEIQDMDAREVEEAVDEALAPLSVEKTNKTESEEREERHRRRREERAKEEQRERDRARENARLVDIVSVEEPDARSQRDAEERTGDATGDGNLSKVRGDTNSDIVGGVPVQEMDFTKPDEDSPTEVPAKEPTAKTEENSSELNSGEKKALESATEAVLRQRILDQMGEVEPRLELEADTTP